MAAFSMPPPTREQVRTGILYALSAVLVFAVGNALIKWQVATYPITQVAFLRCLFALGPCALLVAVNGGLGTIKTARLKAHVVRASIQFLSMIAVYAAYKLLPLADVVAIGFASPLFMTLLSIPFLGERVGRHRWAAVIVGFVGVLVMVRPGAGVFELGAVLVLLNAFLSASLTIVMRRMSVTESSTALICYQIAVATVLSALLLPFGWVWPTPGDWIGLALIGIVSATGQYLWIQAFRHAPTAVAAPFSYTAMIWAIVLGYLVWGDLPTPTLIVGALIVVASGLYILYRETIRRAVQPVTRGAAPGSGGSPGH